MMPVLDESIWFSRNLPERVWGLPLHSSCLQGKNDPHSGEMELIQTGWGGEGENTIQEAQLPFCWVDVHGHGRAPAHLRMWEAWGAP